ncbi:MAG: hypothetical protein LC662_02025 [Rhodothermaceae bacterium]|nr:hypothetical protein [Rhodothermaceae bacterium]
MSGRLSRAALWAGKIVVGGICFYAGVIAGSIVASALGIASPPLPPGVDDSVLGTYLLFSSFFVAIAFALLSPHLHTGFLARWLILTLLAWITLGINTALEATVFTPAMASFGFVMVTYGIAGLAGAAAIAKMVAPPEEHPPFMLQGRRFFTMYEPKLLTLFMVIAVVAFPVIYVIFGWMVQPLIIGFYEEQLAGLRLPGWGELIQVQLLRSLLFLIACLPVLMVWHGSPRSLWLRLGISLFILVGGVFMFQSYWLPAEMRVFHSLEILADSVAYAGVLVLLFARPLGVTSQGNISN